jgi:hypothetical protein
VGAESRAFDEVFAVLGAGAVVETADIVPIQAELRALLAFADRRTMADAVDLPGNACARLIWRLHRGCRSASALRGGSDDGRCASLCFVRLILGIQELLDDLL